MTVHCTVPGTKSTFTTNPCGHRHALSRELGFNDSWEAPQLPTAGAAAGAEAQQQAFVCQRRLQSEGAGVRQQVPAGNSAQRLAGRCPSWTDAEHRTGWGVEVLERKKMVLAQRAGS